MWTPPKKSRVFVLPKETTKYYMVRIGNVVFKDSLNFLPLSLDKLVKSLTGENFQMELTITHNLLKSEGYSES